MRITIQYEASWRNSFLDGSNNEPLPKNGREFIGSMTKLKERKNDLHANFIKRDISIDTVMGILNRLIGDQRKLYQSRLAENYFFADIEKKVTFADLHDKSTPLNAEIVYIRNITGSTDQNAFTGMIKSNHSAFNSDFSRELWGVLWLKFDQLLNFIKDESLDATLDNTVSLDPTTVLNQSILLDELKLMEFDELSKNVVEKLDIVHPGQSYVEAQEKLKPIRIYAAALYIQLHRLGKRFDISNACNRRGSSVYVFGYSKRGFNGARDFMKNFITGEEKPIWGNPYILKERRKGEGEVTSMLTKANGTLEINLDITQEKAEQFKSMIDAAGVSSFYLGKKGLAYVDSIRT